MNKLKQTPKPATAIVGLIGNLAGLYIAYKQKKSFWGYAGYFLLGGISGSVVGYAIDSTIKSIKDSGKSSPPADQKLSQAEAEELIKKLAVGRYTAEGQKAQDDIKTRITSAGYAIKLNADARTYSLDTLQSNFTWVANPKGLKCNTAEGWRSGTTTGGLKGCYKP